MRQKRRDFIKFLIKKGASKRHITYSISNDFNTVIYRIPEENITSMFFFTDKSKFVEIDVTRKIVIDNLMDIYDRVNDINSEKSFLNCSVEDDVLCIKLWAEGSEEEIYRKYREGIELIQKF